VHVRLPILPNGTAGWIPRRSLGAYQTVDTHLVVDRARLLAILYRRGEPVFTAPVGVGTVSSPTPAGEFAIRSRLTRYASPFYGPIAFGTTARSEVLTDWPGGGFVGIHGTDQPELVPGRVSHGCIRMRNAAIRRLAELMPVGTPLTIK
jgi:lipoprotein-anchoring transpeptidase ErfK/SrfK